MTAVLIRLTEADEAAIARVDQIEEESPFEFTDGTTEQVLRGARGETHPQFGVELQQQVGGRESEGDIAIAIGSGCEGQTNGYPVTKA